MIHSGRQLTLLVSEERSLGEVINYVTADERQQLTNSRDNWTNSRDSRLDKLERQQTGQTRETADWTSSRDNRLDKLERQQTGQTRETGDWTNSDRPPFYVRDSSPDGNPFAPRSKQF